MLATVAVGVAPSASLPGTDLGSRSEDWSDYPPRPAVNCEETIKPPLPRCVNFDCDDPLFKRYPPKGTRITAHCSELTVPFTIYDNEVMAMFGSADLAALRAITEGSGYHPVATDAGRGIAMFFAAFQRDGNTVPYFESGIMFSVNDTPVTVASENLYVHVSEMLRPGNEVWFHKLLLSHDMPIEYGRELLGYDKNPAAQNMVVTTDVTMSAVEQTFSFKDPQFNPVVSRRAVVDRNPASRAESLRLLASAPNGGDAVARALSEGGLIRVNAVSPDVLERTDGIVKSHLVARVKTIELGLWDEASSLSVNAGSDYGAALGLIDFRPVVNVYMPFRTILDNGHLP